MKYLNTTLKGDLFEEQIFNLLKELLDNEECFVNGKYSKIYWKKSYYSKDREDDIDFDIAIETYLPNAKTFSILTIIECKNLGRKVPIGKIGAFEANLRQIAGEHNVKGIMISSTYFSQQGVNYAKNKGIGLARVDSKNKIDWVNYRKDKISQEYKPNVIDSYLSTENSDKKFFAYIQDKSFESLPEMLIELKIIDKYIPQRSHIKIPYKSVEQIENKIQQISTKKLYENNRLNTDELCKHLSDIYKVKFNFNETLDYHKKNKILGKLTFNPLELFISKELETNIYRWRFTLAHEIGHLLFHYEILKEYLDENTDTENALSFEEELSTELNKNMETQANTFASILLLPQEPLLIDVFQYFEEENIYKDYLYLDSQRVNLNLVYILLARLKEKYGVSHEAAKYRLISLGLIKQEL